MADQYPDFFETSPFSLVADEQAAQCGYCTNSMFIGTAALCWKNPHPTDAQARVALEGNLCRCGAHLRILRAVQRAAQLLAEGDGTTDHAKEAA